MIEFFSLGAVSKSASGNTDKLLWLNHHYINTLPAGMWQRICGGISSRRKYRHSQRPAAG
ncbi:hypothetical protein MJ579_20825 [Klebsiella pneumoniae]|nr:hypothetical protein MJ579_20825 [Klebsiella pneumoniae]